MREPRISVLACRIAVSNERPLRVTSRRTGAPPGRSAPGGEADEIGARADVGLECRLSGVKRTFDAWPQRVCS